MAAKKIESNSVTTVIEPVEETAAEPTVSVFLPLLEESDALGSVDQTVNVTVNGHVTQIRRGEYVNVKVPVFLQLKNKFPNI